MEVCEMIALKTMDLRNDFKRVSELVNSGEKILIARPRNENLVVLSEREYNELEKMRRNAEHLAKIEISRQEFAEGKTYTFTVDELSDMEDMTAAEMKTFAETHKDY